MAMTITDQIQKCLISNLSMMTFVTLVMKLTNQEKLSTIYQAIITQLHIFKTRSAQILHQIRISKLRNSTENCISCLKAKKDKSPSLILHTKWKNQFINQTLILKKAICSLLIISNQSKISKESTQLKDLLKMSELYQKIVQVITHKRHWTIILKFILNKQEMMQVYRKLHMTSLKVEKN